MTLSNYNCLGLIYNYTSAKLIFQMYTQCKKTDKWRRFKSFVPYPTANQDQQLNNLFIVQN